MRIPRIGSRTGFSLVEAIVAFGILGFAALMLMSSGSLTLKAERDTLSFGRMSRLQGDLTIAVSGTNSCRTLFRVDATSATPDPALLNILPVNATTCEMTGPTNISLGLVRPGQAAQILHKNGLFDAHIRLVSVQLRPVSELLPIVLTGTTATDVRCWIPVEIAITAKDNQTRGSSGVRDHQVSQVKFWIRYNPDPGVQTIEACSSNPPVTVQIPQCKQDESLIQDGRFWDCKKLDLSVKPPDVSCCAGAIPQWNAATSNWKAVRILCPYNGQPENFDPNSLSKTAGVAVCTTCPFPVYGVQCACPDTGCPPP